MTTVHIIAIIPRNHNYCYILEAGDEVVIIDAGEAAPIIDFLDERQLTPSAIWNTHGHWDHVNGNAELLARYGATLPIFDISAPPPSFNGERVESIETPGHTLDHVCFYLPESGLVFTGDTLFSLGCGRLFEGSAEQMWASLEKLMALPDDTLIYCGHEYTASNAKFCLGIEPENEALQERVAEIKGLRANRKPTLPITLGREKETNVFLRASNAARFAELRALKDNA